MKKALLWLIFIAHSVAFTGYVGMVTVGHLKSDKLILILLSISGILTTLTFSEYVLKNDYKHLTRKR